MTSRDFCYWLQGFFELSGAGARGLGEGQVDSIKRHLALVFKHEIDPSMGGPEHQADLNAIHKPAKPLHHDIGGSLPGRPDVLLRC